MMSTATNYQPIVIRHFNNFCCRYVAQSSFELASLFLRHLAQKSRVRFTEQSRNWIARAIFYFDRVQFDLRPQPSRKRHLRRRDGQPAFAQVVTRPDESVTN